MLFESFGFSLHGRSAFLVLPLGFVQRRLRFSDGLLPTFLLLLPGSLLSNQLTLASLMLLLISKSSLSLRPLVDGVDRSLFRFANRRLTGALPWSGSAAKVRRQLGMLTKSAVGSDSAPENDAGVLQRGQQ